MALSSFQTTKVSTIKIYTDKEKQIHTSKRTKMTGKARMTRITKRTTGMTWVTGMT